MRIWVTDMPEAALLRHGAPAGRVVEPIPAEPAASPVAAQVEAVVLLGGEPDAVLDALPALRSLRLVQTLTAGVDWVVDRVPEGVTLCSARGIHDGPVAEWTLGVILAMQRGLAGFRDAQRAGTWAPAETTDLDSSRVLIVGHGSIGRAVEARLAPFGVTIGRVARRARPGVGTFADLPDLLPGADVVVILLPLTPETEEIVDAGFLAAMKPGALLVNAARGRHVVTADLLDALHAGRVRAALDVTDPEPLPEGHPLWTAPGVLITPHAAGDTDGFPRRVMAFARRQLDRLEAGEPLENVVGGGY
jgi:phosphoglycerate dehydrogenase-like enzyme